MLFVLGTIIALLCGQGIFAAMGIGVVAEIAAPFVIVFSFSMGKLVYDCARVIFGKG